MDTEITSDGVHQLIAEATAPETEEEEFERNLDLIHEAKKTDRLRPSPINIELTNAVRIKLPILEWKHYDNLPRKMKITNSGKTVILSAKWSEETPCIVGGPITSEYVLSDIHFHWGKTALEGSEHLIEGGQVALEMHVKHLKKDYKSNSEALKHDDGIIILVYLYEIRFHHNPIVQRILIALKKIRQANSDFHIEPFDLSQLVRPFESDYFCYWGCLSAQEDLYPVLWLINRHLNSISMPQLQLFHQLLDPNLRSISRNWRPITVAERSLFYINPVSPHTNSTMNPKPIMYHETLHHPSVVDTELQANRPENNLVSDF